jgi:hypothetical protein
MIPPAAPDDEARRKLVRNEQLKLTATASNNLAIAAIVTGGIGPAVAATYGVGASHGPFWSAFLLLWLTMGVSLHITGRRILKGIVP